MKNLKRKIAIGSVLFVALWTAQTASAWYSPSLGRWLTRDPIGEPGFQVIQNAGASPAGGRWIHRDPIGERSADGPNRYTFVRNSPANRFDVDGGESWGPPFFPPPQPPTEGVMDCASRIADEVGRQSPFGTRDPSSRWNHCVASCRISRECPGGRFSAWIAGDWYQDPWWQSPSQGSDPGDRAANQVGRSASCNKKKSCEESCNDAFNNGSLYPAPPPPPQRAPIIPLGF